MRDPILNHDERMKSLDLPVCVDTTELALYEPEADSWVELVGDPHNLPDLYVSPTDVYVRLLREAYKPWYIKSVEFIQYEHSRRIQLDVHVGIITLLTLPLFVLWFHLVYIPRLNRVDLISEVTQTDEVKVTFSLNSKLRWSSWSEVKGEEDLLEMGKREDDRVFESYWE